MLSSHMSLSRRYRRLSLSCVTTVHARSYNFELIEILWTFSIFLESIAIVPQLIVLQRYREVENLDGHYIFLLGSYRALYILNWVGDVLSWAADNHSELGIASFATSLTIRNLLKLNREALACHHYSSLSY